MRKLAGVSHTHKDLLRAYATEKEMTANLRQQLREVLNENANRKRNLRELLVIKEAYADEVANMAHLRRQLKAASDENASLRETIHRAGIETPFHDTLRQARRRWLRQSMMIIDDPWAPNVNVGEELDAASDNEPPQIEQGRMDCVTPSVLEMWKELVQTQRERIKALLAVTRDNEDVSALVRKWSDADRGSPVPTVNAGDATGFGASVKGGV